MRLKKNKKNGKDSKRKKEKAVSNEEFLNDRNKGNRQIMFLTYLFCILFIGMIAFLVKYIVFDSQEKINNPYNKRQEILAKKVTRGSIYSADHKVLAKTVSKNGKDVRVYPYGREYCHVVGRYTNSMTGIEESQCYPMLTSHSNPITKLSNDIQGKKNQGDNVISTLQSTLQDVAYQALGDHKGAVVALEPSTGKVLAMVSKPDYDPSTISEQWQTLISENTEESALLNRATQGLYPPGSTFKVMTAMEYIREHQNYKSYQYQCSGSDEFDGNPISCYGHEKHGTVDLETSFAKSCNCSFANMGMHLNHQSFQKLCENFYFNKDLPVKFAYNKSHFSFPKDADAAEVIQTAIGQGKTTITPLQNAMISATIANNGKMMIPYTVDHVETAAGGTVKKYEPKSCGQIIDKKLAKKMKGLMKSVVSEGTARSLSTFSYPVAGKTGSAEFNSEGTSHAWFVGFAPADKPKIAVSIIVEGVGTGSQYAVPIAKQLFSSYLGQ